MTVSPPLNPIMMLLEGNGSLAGRDRSGAFTATGSGALRYATAPGARVNYCPNPLTGPSVVGLVPAGVSLSASTEWVGSGTHSCKVVVTAVAVSSGLFTTSSPLLIRAPAGATVTVSFRVFNPQASSRKIRTLIRGFDLAGSSKGDIVTYTSFVLGANSDTTITQTGVVPSGASGLYVVIYTDNTDPTNPFQNGDVLYVTDLRVNPGASDLGPITNPIWLDPATGQLGTANASPSVSRAQFWVEEATTNLLLDPNATNAFGGGRTSALVSATCTIDTTSAYQGTSSLKVVSAASIGSGGRFHTAASLNYTGSALTFTGSAYVRGSGDLYCQITVIYTDASSDSGSATNFTATNTWTRVTAGSVTTNAAKTVNSIVVDVRNQSATINTYFVDCVQAEQKAYATSYCDGSLGTGYTWAGTAHASASTRAGASVATTTSNRIDVNSSALVMRKTQSSLINNRYFAVIGTNSAGASRLISGTTATLPRWQQQWRENAAGADYALLTQDTLVAGVSQTLYDAWNGVDISHGMLSDVSLQTGIRSLPNFPFGPDMWFGQWSAVNQINGQIGPVAIYDEPLSTARRTMVNAAIDSNGATDLWTLFEEWETTLSPFDLFDLETISGGAGVVASLSPIDLFDLEAGVAGAGVRALMDPLDFGFDYEDVIGASPIPLPASIDWDDASPLVSWSTP